MICGIAYAKHPPCIAMLLLQSHTSEQPARTVERLHCTALKLSEETDASLQTRTVVFLSVVLLVATYSLYQEALLDCTAWPPLTFKVPANQLLCLHTCCASCIAMRLHCTALTLQEETDASFQTYIYICTYIWSLPQPQCSEYNLG